MFHKTLTYCEKKRYNNRRVGKGGYYGRKTKCDIGGKGIEGNHPLYHRQ